MHLLFPLTLLFDLGMILSTAFVLTLNDFANWLHLAPTFDSIYIYIYIYIYIIGLKFGVQS